jgi:ATP-dependent helicase/nuclease subunit B
MSFATLPELLDALDSDARLLLPNARAARALRSAFDARQRLSGLSAWEPPQVLSWSQWTNSLWSELIVGGVESRLLLNTAQEHSLWREIIAEDATNTSFGSADSLAELARSAWQLAAGYNATHRLRGFATTHDSRIFVEWAEAFSKRCAARGYLSAALLDSALLQHVQAGVHTAPDSLELVGFGEIRPSQEVLLAALRERGTEVIERGLEARAEDRRLRASVGAVNEREELLLAARWIRGFLEETQVEERGARVAVLLPNLSEERAEVEEVLRETLAPELQSIGSDLSSTPWEFSGGVPLSSLAMIVDALALARWAEGPLPLARVSSLLLSPYVGRSGVSNEDLDASARFDASRLRRMLLLRSEIEISGVLELTNGDAQTFDERTLFAWLHNVQEFLQRIKDKNRPRSFAEWMEFVRGLMQAANWLGNRALTASEFEAASAWESTLDMVSTLDFSGRRVAFADALQALELQAQTTIFAPPSTDALVQVMNVAEAEGSIFDAVVFLRATDANWPATERVNPLLPWALQRSVKMPGSDPVLTAARCRAFTDDLLTRSGDVLFTYATEDGSGKLRPSPLLAAMGIEHLDAEKLIPPARPVETVAVENDVDESALPALPSSEVAGGAAVLKLQAACGFLAFAELRLRATEPKRGSMGLDAGESGSLLHRALQNFWKKVETQEALKSMSWVERDRILARAIDEALPRRLQVRDGWDRAYLALQTERLRSLLQHWLEEELKRGPFTVLAVEQDQALTVGPLTLNVRMDRIDRVGEGVFFVDYKTGYAADPKQWVGERPDDPQLPLYTLLPEVEELKGVAFAKVRTGREMKWLGYQAEEGILPGSPRSKTNVRDMASLVEEWRGTLTRLAEDFAAGRADVRPKSFEVNCTHCAQRLLCRLDSTSLLAVADEDDEEREDVDG